MNIWTHLYEALPNPRLREISQLLQDRSLQVEAESSAGSIYKLLGYYISKKKKGHVKLIGQSIP